MTPRTFLLALALGVATPLGAQILRVPSPADNRRPLTLSVGTGWLQSQNRFDGATNRDWLFDNVLQHRVGLDVAVRGVALGLSGSLATIPTFESNGVTVREGEVGLTQLLFTIRSRGGEGFHQLIEASAGVSRWGKFEPDAGTATAGETASATTLALGYGFGYGLSNRATFYVIQDGSYLFGSKDGLPDGVSSTTRQYVTRLGFRWRLVGVDR